jgi:transcription elongation GreA/GreB family factor
MGLDKMQLIEQLGQRIRESEAVAQRAGDDAREAARHMATESEKKEDGRVALEFGSLAKGQEARSRKAQEDLAALAAFTRAGVPAFGPRSAVSLGALVDVSSEGERGPEERTFFLLPVGAGTELHGPGGDGFLSVITPASPVGRALVGRRAGDTVEVTIKGQTSEWTVVEVS